MNYFILFYSIYDSILLYYLWSPIRFNLWIRGIRSVSQHTTMVAEKHNFYTTEVARSFAVIFDGLGTPPFVNHRIATVKASHLSLFDEIAEKAPKAEKQIRFLCSTSRNKFPNQIAESGLKTFKVVDRQTDIVGCLLTT
jgi:hypothetical protein